MRFIVILEVVLGLLSPMQVMAGGTNGAQLRMYGKEFRVNSTSSGCYQPVSATTNDDNSFEIIFKDCTTGPTYNTLYSKTFDLNGNQIGGESKGNFYYQPAPQIATAMDGSFVRTWVTVSDGILMQMFNPDSSPKGNPVIIDNVGFNSQREPTIAMAGDGTFIITWSRTVQIGNRCCDFEIAAKRFDASGKGIGHVFRVNTTNNDYQYTPLIAMAPNGSFVITWMTTKYISLSHIDWDVMAQIFEPTGR